MDEGSRKTLKKEIANLSTIGGKVESTRQASYAAIRKLASFLPDADVPDEHGIIKKALDAPLVFKSMGEFLQSRQEYCTQSLKHSELMYDLAMKNLKNAVLPIDDLRYTVLLMDAIDTRDNRIDQLADCVVNMFFLAFVRTVVSDSRDVQSMQDTMRSFLPVMEQLRNAFKAKAQEKENVEKIVNGFWENLKNRGVIS